MNTRYTTERLTLAIREYLMDVDALPPRSAVTRLAVEITAVVLRELNSAGLSTEGLEHLFASANEKPKVRANAHR